MISNAGIAEAIHFQTPVPGVVIKCHQHIDADRCYRIPSYFHDISICNLVVNF